MHKGADPITGVGALLSFTWAKRLAVWTAIALTPGSAVILAVYFSIKWGVAWRRRKGA